MKKSLFFGLMIWGLCQAKDPSMDFLDQVGLIKSLLPDAKVVGVMVGPQDLAVLKNSIAQAQVQYGIKIVSIALSDVKQKLPQYVKMAAAGVVKTHGIQALMFVEGLDEVTKSQVGIKLTSGEMQKSGVPIFSANEKGLQLGCLGQFIQSGEEWIMNLSTESAEKLNVTVPKNDTKFKTS